MENVVAHSQPSYSHQAGGLPAGVSFASANTSSGLSFFERLFGGPTPTPAPAPAPRRPAHRAINH
jgi:hypothetical protein